MSTTTPAITRDSVQSTRSIHRHHAWYEPLKKQQWYYDTMKERKNINNNLNAVAFGRFCRWSWDGDVWHERRPVFDGSWLDRCLRTWIWVVRWVVFHSCHEWIPNLELSSGVVTTFTRKRESSYNHQRHNQTPKPERTHRLTLQEHTLTQIYPQTWLLLQFKLWSNKFRNTVDHNGLQNPSQVSNHLFIFPFEFAICWFFSGDVNPSVPSCRRPSRRPPRSRYAFMRSRRSLRCNCEDDDDGRDLHFFYIYIFTYDMQLHLPNKARPISVITNGLLGIVTVGHVELN